MDIETSHFTYRKYAALLASMVLLITSAIAASDIYLPTLPDLRSALGISEALAEQTVTIYFLGMMLGNVLLGPLSDRIGRRNTLMVSYALSLVGGWICWNAGQIDPILLGRLLQGFASGGLIVIVRAALRDLFSGEDLIKASGAVGSFVGFIPPLAPLAGGYVGHHCGWRANFLAMMIAVIVSGLAAMLYMPETLPSARRVHKPVRTTLKCYGHMLSSVDFMTASLAGGLTMGAMLAFITESPFLLRAQLGLSAVHFGWAIAAVTPTMLIGTTINHKIAHRYDQTELLRIGTSILIFGGLLNLVLGLAGIFNPYTVIIPMMIIMIAVGIVFPSAFAIATDRFANSAGTASALYGAINNAVGTIGSASMAICASTNQIPLAISQTAFGMAALSLAIWGLMSFRAKQTAHSRNGRGH